MVKTIGNPLSWGYRRLSHAGRGVAHAADKIGTHVTEPPRVRHITTDDIRAALRAGWQDFLHFRTDVLMVCLLYPVIGLLLVWFALDANLIPLIFPLVSGFALVGPVAALGLYEMSRRRELGQHADWGDALRVFASPTFGPIFLLGVYLLVIFLIWMLAAQWIYNATMGPLPPASLGAFVTEALTTAAGWEMIVTGTMVGLGFAVLVLAITVVSFPLLLDRDVGLPMAVVTSVKVTRKNPRAVATWGMIVAAGLVVGSLPALLGLALVMPVLGHASWHLYRRAVEPPSSGG